MSVWNLTSRSSPLAGSQLGGQPLVDQDLPGADPGSLASVERPEGVVHGMDADLRGAGARAGVFCASANEDSGRGPAGPPPLPGGRFPEVAFPDDGEVDVSEPVQRQIAQAAANGGADNQRPLRARRLRRPLRGRPRCGSRGGREGCAPAGRSASSGSVPSVAPRPQGAPAAASSAAARGSAPASCCSFARRFPTSRARLPVGSISRKREYASIASADCDSFSRARPRRQ